MQSVTERFSVRIAIVRFRVRTVPVPARTLLLKSVIAADLQKIVAIAYCTPHAPPVHAVASLRAREGNTNGRRPLRRSILLALYQVATKLQLQQQEQHCELR